MPILAIKEQEIFDKLDVLTNLCTTGDKEFNKRKCLTYVDEFEKNISKNLRAVCIVSFTSLKDNYIEYFEIEWLKLRSYYNIPNGVPIHFTSLRSICNKIDYTDSNGSKKESVGWNHEYVIKKYEYFKDLAEKGGKKLEDIKDFRKFLEQYSLWKCFSKVDSNGIKSLDFEILNNFYKELLVILSEANIKILCTTFLYDVNANHKKRGKSNYKAPYCMAFLDHLNLLCFYLKHAYMTDYELKSNSLYSKHFTTKLRCDADDGYSNRNDYRLSFNEAMTSGTRQFSGDAIRDTIDEIRFINKKEIGYQSDNKDMKQNIISHVGCDIIDFIAYYVGMYSIKGHLVDSYINEFLKDGAVDKKEASGLAEKKFLQSVTLNLNNNEYDIYNNVLKNKIIHMNNYKTVQIISDCNFLYWE